MKRIVAIFAAAWLATGCLSPHGVIVTDVLDRTWSDTVQLKIANEDTLSRCTISLVIRYDERLQVDTLPLKLIFTAPDSLRTTECITFRIPHQHEPAAVMHEAELPYRTGVVLNQSGNYSLSVVPQEGVEGILAVGVNIR